MPTRNDAYHIYSFDLTRTLAAMAVILLHWKEFVIPGKPPPFEHALHFFYTFGAFAVPLFFTLSGFIFTWLYADIIRDQRVGPRDFFIFRLSRLYPLYIATFLVAAMTEPFSGYVTSILYNDPYHALLSVVMLTGWGLERGFSFNAPSWSVSTEMFLYGAFFVTARFIRIGFAVAIALVVMGIALVPLSVHIAGGLAQFFAGAVAYRAFSLWSVHRRRRWVATAAAVATMVMLVYAWEFYAQTGLQVVRSIVPHFPKLDLRYAIMRDLLFPTILFPMLIFVQASLEFLGANTALARHTSVRWAGNISYAIYLWHFPLIMIGLMLAKSGVIPPLTFYTPVGLLAYTIVLLGMSHLSFYGFERPAMRAIRACFGVRRSI